MKKIVLSLILMAQIISANMYHLKVLSDKVPDLSNIETFGHDIGDKWQTNNEKAIILNYWIDQLTTYDEPLYFSRQWDDPIAFLNNNEYGMCSDMTLLMNAMGEGAFGFTGRHHELGLLNTPIEHTVPEIEYDGTLHLLDPSFGFAYGHDDNGIVTSMQQYALNPYFSRNNTPAALTRDSDGAGPIKAWLSADNFGWSIDRFRYDEYSPELTWIEKKTEGYYGVHRFDISIEDYEYYTRYWRHLEGLADFNPHDFYWPVYNYNDTNNYTWRDNDHQKGAHRSNGLWVYEPSLADANSYESKKNITVENGTAYPTYHAEEGTIVFKVDTANFVTGVLLEADIKRNTAADSVVIEASSSGGAYWFPIWHNEAVGDITIKKNISNMIKGTLQSQDLRHVTDFLVRVKLFEESGNHSSSLKSIKLSTVTMLGKSSLPKLMLGSNEITLDGANNHSLYQTKTLDPVLTKLENGTNDKIHWENTEAWKLYAVDHHNMVALENFGNLYTILAKSQWQTGWVTYELDAPRPIKKARLGGSFIVEENTDDKFKIYYRVFNGAWGAWQEVATYDWNSRNNADKRENQSHLESWEITEAGVTKVQFKTEVYNSAHIEALHMEIDYEAKPAPQKPLYVTYSWTEYYENAQGDLPVNANGGVTRTYKEKITNLPHKFTINVGGVIQPRMNWVSMNLEGNEDPINNAPLGYSDGVDKGNGAFIPMIKYDIGNIISISKPVTLSTQPVSGTKEQLTDGRIVAASDGQRGNQGGGKVEVQNDADDIVKFASGFGTLDIVIDLGSVKSVGGVRVDAFKPNVNAYFPESVSVEVATTNNQFTPIAHDAYKSAKYAHNLWPVAWSLPPNAYSKYSGRFPNYGLLSNYIFVPFTNQVQARYIKIKIKEQNYGGSPKGLTLAEVHVYDKLIANQWSPKLKHARENVVVPPTISTVNIASESGNIVAPMQVKNSTDAHGGSYITTENGHGSISYTFEVQSAGTYKIWGRHIAPDGYKDSFFIKMDNGVEDIWDIENSNSWRWTKVNGRAGGGERSFNLTAGTHTLVIRGREGGVKLDEIVVTNDANFVTPLDPVVEGPVIFEAEDGVLTEPMAKRADNNAFSQKYILTPNGNGKATYTFSVATAGTYTLWGRHIAPSLASNSFFIKIDNDVEDIWDVDLSNGWTWSKVNGRANGGRVRSFDLTAGVHTLVVTGRESRVKLDELIITKDAQYVPENPELVNSTIEIEAEHGVIENPISIEQDNLAFNRKNIVANSESGKATYQFYVDLAGNYKVFARYIAQNMESNSFFVKMDNGAEDIWDMDVSGSWKWDILNGRNLGGSQSYDLTVGTHTLVVKAREIGAKIDKLVITNNQQYVLQNSPHLDEVDNPNNLTFENVTQTSVTLRWDDVEGEIGYKIYRNNELIFIADPNVTTYTDNGLAAHTLYTYTVKTTR